MLEGRNNKEKKLIDKDKLDACVGEEVQVQWMNESKYANMHNKHNQHANCNAHACNKKCGNR